MFQDQTIDERIAVSEMRYDYDPVTNSHSVVITADKESERLYDFNTSGLAQKMQQSYDERTNIPDDESPSIPFLFLLIKDNAWMGVLLPTILNFFNDDGLGKFTMSEIDLITRLGESVPCLRITYFEKVKDSSLDKISIFHLPLSDPAAKKFKRRGGANQFLLKNHPVTETNQPQIPQIPQSPKLSIETSPKTLMEPFPVFEMDSLLQWPADFF